MMIKFFLVGSYNIFCSYMMKDEKNLRLGNWGFVYIGFVNDSF